MSDRREIAPGVWIGTWEDVVGPALILARADNARLRALVKMACHPWCPWCDSHLGEPDPETHEPDCPAFTQTGEVK